MESRNIGKITGFICGSYDLLHSGHLLSFAMAKTKCEFLIVGLHTDPTIDRPKKNKPIQSVFERYYQLECCRDVDEIIPYESEHDLENILRMFQIDYRFVGSDYKGKDFTGKQYCENSTIEIVYLPREHDFSSTELRGRINNGELIEKLNTDDIQRILSYPNKHAEEFDDFSHRLKEQHTQHGPYNTK